MPQVPQASPLTRPVVFIGSSTESLEIAQGVNAGLTRFVNGRLWSTGVFGLGSLNIEALADAADEADFAILIMTGDDLTEMRGQQHYSPRDNVIFEFGLFRLMPDLIIGLIWQWLRYQGTNSFAAS